MIDELLVERGARADAGEDLLGLMVSARDGETGQPMSRKQIGDELMTFMLAGHETTSNALSWMWRQLSLNPWAREKLFDEVDDAIGDRTPDDGGHGAPALDPGLRRRSNANHATGLDGRKAGARRR